MSKEFYSTAEAAKILRLSRVGVFKQIRSGRLKADKVGRNYIIPHSALTEALGKEIGKQRKEEIERVIEKASKAYSEVFKRLGKE